MLEKSERMHTFVFDTCRRDIRLPTDTAIDQMEPVKEIVVQVRNSSIR